ncbi:alpha/beta hydrolase fold domain-containing protein [Conexibacter sp. CPCC 206217]|uniref:alpha/beta hydrolase fold domain-containing protein n=1 Tax=Conexibacter sp. CPCC 206217 TaxID=3064574 RepID=UPI0027284851|nr:alpha/beta hydrolase fold domain-containing protein [Conexibacter sp. CPCC 206217]MDO8211046.1 alpha/beta hydrolase fold domain-containing protein [Conexibacter sp. CPCC 206217]
MDPEVVAAILADGRFALGERGPQPTLELLAEMRAMPPRVPYEPTPPAGVLREERLVPGAPGAPDVPVRIYRPAERADGERAAIVWMHGGGLMAGSYDMDQPFLDALVLATGCVAVSVDYRLAPETPFPGPMDDCYAVLEHVHAAAAALGVDAGRLAVGGSSAGAGLAAACALRARDAGIDLIHQHLIYPMLDDRQLTASSQWDLLAIWPRELNAFAWRCYLGDGYDSGDVPAYAAPARAAELAGLAPAYIHVGGLDGFVHEDVDYAARLLSAGVPTELHVLPLVPHGFDMVAPAAAVTARANALSDAALARVLS